MPLCEHHLRKVRRKSESPRRYRVDGEYWFVLLDVPESELRRLKMQSDLEYLAMMTGVEL